MENNNNNNKKKAAEVATAVHEAAVLELVRAFGMDPEIAAVCVEAVLKGRRALADDGVGKEMVWLQMIFFDSNKPAGQRTLGVVVIEVPVGNGDDKTVSSTAILKSHQLGINVSSKEHFIRKRQREIER